MWLLGSNIAIIMRTVRTGHVVSVMSFRILVVGSNIVIGLYVPDKWTVLCCTCGCWYLFHILIRVDVLDIVVSNMSFQRCDRNLVL